MKTVTLEVADLLSILDFTAVEMRLASIAGVHRSAFETLHALNRWFSGCRLVPEYSTDAAWKDAIFFASKQEQRVDPDLPRQYPSLAGAEHRRGRCPGVGGRTGRGKHRD